MISKALLTSVAFFGLSVAAFANTVNVYSYRNPELMAPIYEAFTKESGIAVNAVFLEKGLVERVQSEGKNSPADVVLTVDISRLQAAKEADILAPIADAPFLEKIPAQYQDTDKQWFGLTVRGRVVYASKERFKENTISYADLASEKLKGKVCTRSGQHVYTLGLIASQIAHNGVDATRTWLEGVKANLARKPAGGDRDQAQAIAAGECDVALGNTYYVPAMLKNVKEPEQRKWAEAIKVIFPDQAGKGTHVNISGMGLVKTAPNKDNALKFMAFLASDQAQELYATLVHEYPVVEGIAIGEDVKALGTGTFDPLPLSDIAKYIKDAARLVDEVGLDN